MGKGFLKSIAKGIKAPIQFVGKIHRETFRIIDQGLEKANAAIEKTGFNKILGGSSIGVSTSSGSSGGSNVYFKPAGSSNSVGVGLSNSGDASLFVNNNVAVPLTTPKANFITTENVEVEYSDNNITKNETDAVSNALAERDQLLREIYGPGYIPESSLATISAIAIGSATNQLLHDTWDTANTIANVHLNNNVIIHSMNETERADAWNRNQEIYGDVSNAVSNVYANPAIIPAYYANRFEESSNIFSSSLESGNLIGAGNAVGQTIYDSYVIASTVTGATALTAQAITATNNFVSTNNFRSPLVFQFEGARLNSGLPLDQVKFRKSISKKRDTKNPVADNTAHEPIEYTQLNEQSDIITYAQGNSVSNEFKIEKIAQNTELGLFHQYNRNIDLTIRNPNAVAIQMGWGELSPRQTHLLDQLSKSGKAITIKKNHINAYDLSCLTAKTGDEFAMFTLGSRRIILRGNATTTPIPDLLMEKLRTEKWTWSAHTHPANIHAPNLTPSGLTGDVGVLLEFDQEQSMIINSFGKIRVFDLNSIDYANYIDPTPKLKGKQ